MIDAEDIKQLKAEKEKRRTKIRKYFSNLLNIRGDMMSYEEIDEMMKENTVIHGSNMWILMLAIFIASIGKVVLFRTNGFVRI